MNCKSIVRKDGTKKLIGCTELREDVQLSTARHSKAQHSTAQRCAGVCCISHLHILTVIFPRLSNQKVHFSGYKT
jgi:hypothetical protein